MAKKKKKKASDAPGPKSVIESNRPTPPHAPAATARTPLGACVRALRGAPRPFPASPCSCGGGLEGFETEEAETEQEAEAE